MAEEFIIKFGLPNTINVINEKKISCDAQNIKNTLLRIIDFASKKDIHSILFSSDMGTNPGTGLMQYFIYIGEIMDRKAVCQVKYAMPLAYKKEILPIRTPEHCLNR